jgi:lipoate-protein ligase A
MYEADTGEMARALKVNGLKLRDKGVASVKSRVTNISGHMPKAMDIEDFRTCLFRGVMKNADDARLVRLSEEDWREVKIKAAGKHATPEWIYGHSPAFNVQKETKHPGGIIQTYLGVIGGRLETVKIFGDFFGDKDIKEVETALTGVLYEIDALRNALEPLTVGEYFGNISLDELIDAII